jgi:hypothetical protein
MLFAKNNPTKVLESFFFFSRTPIMNKPYGATCWCMGVWFPKGLYFFCNMLTHGDSTCNFVDAWGFNFQTINFACGGKKSKVHLGFLFFGASTDVWGQQFTSFMKFMVCWCVETSTNIKSLLFSCSYVNV